MFLGQPTRASWWPGRAHGDAKRADEKLVELTGSGRRCRAMSSRLAAKRSSPPLGAGRGPVNEGRGSYPWCCCGLGLGEVCGGRDPSCWAMSVPPCYTPQETAPACSPPSSSFSPPSAPRIWPVNLWVRLAGVLGCLPKHFLGKTAAISRSPLVFFEDETLLYALLDTSNSNSPLHASTAASHLLPKGSATPTTPCLSCLA